MMDENGIEMQTLQSPMELQREIEILCDLSPMLIQGKREKMQRMNGCVKMRFEKGHKTNLGKHWKLSDYTKKKMSESKKGIPMTTETKQKMREYYQSHPEAKERIRLVGLSKRGQKLSSETRKRMSQPRSLLHRQNISKSLIGNKRALGHKNIGIHNGMFGKHHTAQSRKMMGEKISIVMRGKPKSQEHREKIKLARSKQIVPQKDTSIEVIMQNILRKRQIPFITHPPIKGQPDQFVSLNGGSLLSPGICIFEDGCWWHQCPHCYPKRSSYISVKNRPEQDSKITEELQRQGYKVVRIWEHELKEPDKVLEKILGWR